MDILFLSTILFVGTYIVYRTYITELHMMTQSSAVLQFALIGPHMLLVQFRCPVGCQL